MGVTYVTIERNVEVYEKYRAMWRERGVEGIRAETMTEGIELAISIEKSKTDHLYFIAVVADNIDFMPQLKILNEITTAPILVATTHYDVDEHHAALRNGAHFYGQYCKKPEQNMDAVVAVVESYHRARKRRTPPRLYVYELLMILPDEHRVFVTNIEASLTEKEYEILYLLFDNKGTTLTFEQIFSQIWGNDYENAAVEQLRNHITRLRKKLTDISPDCDYIKNIYGVGYRFELATNKKQ